MKMVTLVSLVIVLSASLIMAAEDSKASDGKGKTQTVEKSAKNKRLAAPKEEDLLTGSHTKQKVHRNGQITDGQSPVIVLDRATVEKSGAADVRQLLSRQGVH